MQHFAAFVSTASNLQAVRRTNHIGRTDRVVTHSPWYSLASLKHETCTTGKLYFLKPGSCSKWFCLWTCSWSQTSGWQACAHKQKRIHRHTQSAPMTHYTRIDKCVLTTRFVFKQARSRHLVALGVVDDRIFPLQATVFRPRACFCSGEGHAVCHRQSNGRAEERRSLGASCSAA